jgi:hypothetical protein
VGGAGIGHTIKRYHQPTPHAWVPPEDAAARGQSPEALGSFKQRDQARPAAIAIIQRATPAWPGISFPEDAVSYIPLVVIEAEG